MGIRRQARELAMQALFYFDAEEKDVQEMLEQFCINFDEQLIPEVKPFFLDLVNGVMTHRSKIDALLEKYSRNWKISRMPAVDRNIMRIATLEFLEHKDIPASVSINEAVDIGKKFGTRDSGKFINGVLDRIHNLENIDSIKSA
ncbi:MAG: transcription antitermination factor NusB [Desulfobacteraceae bacterium]|nr:MAG: transcription antitermination factor NusB [Desulfobacteraceae bacterium]